MEASYKTHGYYKVRSLIRLKIVWNGPDVSKQIINNSVIRLTTLIIRLKFRKQISYDIKYYIFLLFITDFDPCFIMCKYTTHFIVFHIYLNYRNHSVKYKYRPIIIPEYYNIKQNKPK